MDAGPAAASSVTVLFFAGAREATGTARASALLDQAGATTLGELIDRLVADYGAPFQRLLRTSSVWVNGEPAEEDRTLRAGDEVAVLPPVSGG
jgi:molybdopterin converting factor small subunit